MHAQIAVLLASLVVVSFAAAQTTELDRAAMKAVEGRNMGGYLCRLEPWTINAAPPEPVVSVLKVVLPKGEPLALRINCGMDLVDPGWQYRDERGRTWLADRDWHEGAQWGVEGGGAVVRDGEMLKLSEPIPLEGLYRAERYAASAYRFKLPPGRYDLRLHFMETYDLENAEPGRRAFDVSVQGRAVLKAFDPFAEGGAAVPVVRQVDDVDVADGALLIEFKSGTAEPAVINGIEILGREPLAEPFGVERGELPLVGVDGVRLPAAPGAVVGRYLCGVAGRALPGYELVTSYGGGAAWLPDIAGAGNGFWAVKGGAGQRHAPILFANTPVPQVLRHERFGGDGYEFPVPEAGAYGLRLHFAEGFEGNYRPGLRVYDVGVEGQTVLEDFDPVAAGGGFAHASIFDVHGVRVTDGRLSLSLTSRVGHAALNAVEIFRDEDPPDVVAVTQIVGPAERRPAPVAGEGRRKLRVFYLGNSHTFFWAMPETVAAAVNETPGVEIEMVPYRLLHGGWVLRNFYAQHGRPGAPSALEIIEQGKYDVAVLQVMPGAKADFNAQLLEALRAFADAADRAGTRIMLYVFSPLARVDEASRTELLGLVRQHDMLVIPAGEGLAALYARAGQAPLPLSMRGVGVHLGFHPAYMNACMHYAAWTGKSPVNMPTPALVGQDVRVEPARARFLQELAWEAYQEARRDYGLQPFPDAP